MNVNISIDGVLRKTIERLEYHYVEYYIEAESEDDDPFEYGINYPIKNDNLLKYFKFQSLEEFENFLFVEFPLEIFGHSNSSYSSVFNDLNKLIFSNQDITFTIIGLNEKGRAKPASLFFLSKNNFLGDNVKFITSDDLKTEWDNCDAWITDNDEIIMSTPKRKKIFKINTKFNQDKSYQKYNIPQLKEINKLSEIQTTCLKSSENYMLSILTEWLSRVKSILTPQKEGKPQI